MTMGMVKITNILLQCVGIVYSDIQAVCRSSRIVTALVLKFTIMQWGSLVPRPSVTEGLGTRLAVGCNCSVDFLPNAEHLNEVEK